MTPDDAAGQILLDGLSDWVELDMARQYVQDAHPDVPFVELRRLTIDTVRWLLDHELVVVGDLREHFVPWLSAPADTMARIDTEWRPPERWLAMGEVCWLAITPAGDEVGRRLAAEQRARRG